MQNGYSKDDETAMKNNGSDSARQRSGPGLVCCCRDKNGYSSVAGAFLYCSCLALSSGITFAARLAGKEPPERRQELMNNQRRRQSKATSGGQIYVGTEGEGGEGATQGKLINSNYQLAKSHPPPSL